MTALPPINLNWEHTEVICPECGATMLLRKTKAFKYPNGSPRKFYGCSRWPACSATHGAHPTGKPLGTPADPDTKRARIQAHEVFDQLWKGGRMSRGKAYAKLARLMGREVVHIGEFSKEECDEAVRVLQGYV